MFEYQEIRVANGGIHADPLRVLLKQAAEMSSEGWELFSVMHLGNNLVGLLKRQKR